MIRVSAGFVGYPRRAAHLRPAARPGTGAVRPPGRPWLLRVYSGHTRREEAVVLRGQFDDHVEPFLDADRLGQRREDRVSMLSDLLVQMRLVRVGAFPRGYPPQELLEWHPSSAWLGRLRSPPQRGVQQGIELGDQVLDLACGNPFGQRLQYRASGQARRRVVGTEPLPDPGPELIGRHDIQVPALRLRYERIEGLREASRQVR